MRQWATVATAPTTTGERNGQRAATVEEGMESDPVDQGPNGQVDEQAGEGEAGDERGQGRAGGVLKVEVAADRGQDRCDGAVTKGHGHGDGHGRQHVAW